MNTNKIAIPTLPTSLTVLSPKCHPKVVDRYNCEWVSRHDNGNGRSAPTVLAALTALTALIARTARTARTRGVRQAGLDHDKLAPPHSGKRT